MSGTKKSSKRPPGLITRADLAKLTGLTRGYITQKVQDGTLTLIGGKFLNKRDAIAALKKGVDPLKSRKRDLTGAAQVDADPEAADKTNKKNKIPPLAESIAAERAYKAGEAKLNYEKKRGGLLERDEVNKLWFTTIRNIRDGVNNIPVRTASKLMSLLCKSCTKHKTKCSEHCISDTTEIERAVQNEVDLVLSEISEKL